MRTGGGVKASSYSVACCDPVSRGAAHDQHSTPLYYFYGGEFEAVEAVSFRSSANKGPRQRIRVKRSPLMEYHNGLTETIQSMNGTRHGRSRQINK
ncbi:unnamed protein product [Danaus chrysippus]|uniref:(African queen) hypothetical protein n=1 Tax=Danaus chrysippus TaxID=151541 RepID=A0A8J2R9X6_9NEOP|nr:unnamed protein product [Danaus chrysippus]